VSGRIDTGRFRETRKGITSASRVRGNTRSRLANYFPNMDEYGIKDSLAVWYRINDRVLAHLDQRRR